MLCVSKWLRLPIPLRILIWNFWYKYLSYFVETEEVNVAPTQQPTDNGIAKEFDPLGSSKEEQPKPVQQVPVKCMISINHFFNNYWE